METKLWENPCIERDDREIAIATHLQATANHAQGLQHVRPFAIDVNILVDRIAGTGKIQIYAGENDASQHIYAIF